MASREAVGRGESAPDRRCGEIPCGVAGPELLPRRGSRLRRSAGGRRRCSQCQVFEALLEMKATKEWEVETAFVLEKVLHDGESKK